jgi:hypothetical protein
MKYWLIVILAISIVSCQDVKYPEKPKNLIPKDKMAEVLTEAYLANAARSVDNKSLLANGVLIDSLLYAKFGIDSLQFLKSNDYYATNVNAYMEIFEKVEFNLTRLERNLDSIREANYTRNDSVPKKPINAQD